MDKVLDMKKTLYELYKEDPDILDIMKEIGFDKAVEPGMINTAGRFMTIPKGAAMRKISMETVKEAFTRAGYIVKES